MTLIDFFKLGIINSDSQAERFAADLIDCWHNDQIPGELNDILGLTAREYQAWTTGGVSLLTIAHWQANSHPPLDTSKPWFKVAGRPPREVVGYLDEAMPRSKGGRKSAARKQPLV